MLTNSDLGNAQGAATATWNEIYFYPIKTTATHLQGVNGLSNGVPALDTSIADPTNQLGAAAETTIQRVRKILHHGLANQEGQTGHKEHVWFTVPLLKYAWKYRQTQGEYRHHLVSRIDQDLKAKFQAYQGWWSMVGMECAAALVTKSGPCTYIAATAFCYLLATTMCRVTLIWMTKPDHAIVVISAGGKDVLVDPWVKEPSVCYLQESCWWNGVQNNVTVYVADVFQVGNELQDMFLAEARLSKSVQKPQVVGLKGQENSVAWDHASCWNRSVGTQLGKSTTQAKLVELDDPHTMQGLSEQTLLEPPLQLLIT